MTQKRIPFSITPTSVIVMLNGKTYTLTEGSHQHYSTIRQALRDKDYDTVEKLIDLAHAINTFGSGKIKVVNGVVMYGDHELHNAATRRLLEQMAEGFDVEPMVKFLENVMQNPSKRAVDELYRFLEHNSLPITDDGHFVAYKRVTHDFKDFYTGKMDNSIGAVVEMPRNFVNDNKDETCSQGLHFCSLSYLPHYYGGQGRIVIVKVNPADVVSIPTDYNNAKGRACKYLILEEYEGGELNEKFDTSVYGVSDDSNLCPEAEECWSCGAFLTEEQISDNDGLCPHCDSEVSDEDDWGYEDEGLLEEDDEDLNVEDDWMPPVTIPTPVKSNPLPPVTINPAAAWPFPTQRVNSADWQTQPSNTAPVQQPSPTAGLMTREEAAKHLGISVDALRKRLDRGVSVKRVFQNGVEYVKVL